MPDRSSNEQKAQFLTLPWNLDHSAAEGEGGAQGVPVHALDTIEIDSYVDAEKGTVSHDITLHFNNGAQPIQSKGNAVEVLKTIDKKKEGGLSRAFVQVNRYDYVHSPTGGIGTGWAKQSTPEIVSVPDFLKRNA